MSDMDKMRRDAIVHGQGVLLNGKHVPLEDFYISPVGHAVRQLGATPSDIPGLWYVAGHPELTTNQLISLAAK